MNDHHFPARGYVRYVKPLAALTFFVITSLTALAQNPQLSALYQGANPKGDFAFTWKDKGTFTKSVGMLRWEVPPSEFNTGGMDRSFTGYCSEPLVPIIAGNLYRYELQKPDMPSIYGLPETDDGRREATRRAQYVRELFGRYYLNSNRVDNSQSALAFQAALWEVIYESEFPDVPAPFNLLTGTFRANYPSLAQAPPYVQEAQKYLLSLTGNDLATFYENTAINGRELVHMKGLESVNAGATTMAQSQFGLRDNSGGGGVPGFNGATALPGNPGGAGLSAFGPGAGSGFGGPALFAGGGGGGGGATGSDTPTSNPNTSGGPPTNTPPTEGGGPPTQQPENPGTPTQQGSPVPAPPAAVLGLIAIGLFAGRRTLHRFHRTSV